MLVRSSRRVPAEPRASEEAVPESALSDEGNEEEVMGSALTGEEGCNDSTPQSKVERRRKADLPTMMGCKRRVGGRGYVVGARTELIGECFSNRHRGPARGESSLLVPSP